MAAPGRAPRVVIFTALAMIAFAANSILCREALGAGAADAASFTAIRIASGAVALVLLAALRPRAAAPRAPARGSWASAFALVGYAVAFSFAYLRLPAGAGALILFGSVQATMIGVGLGRGERLAVLQWIGLGVAVGGLIFLTAPGSTAPDPLGVALMAGAGVAWGIYSLRGSGAADPLGTTAANFARALPLALMPVPLAAFAHLVAPAAEAVQLHVELRGVLLAVASGAVASGVGYAIWYAALRDLPATIAAVVQLVVPVLAAAAGVLLLGEPATKRLVIGGAAIVVGLAVTLRGRTRPSPGPDGAARG